MKRIILLLLLFFIYTSSVPNSVFAEGGEISAEGREAEKEDDISAFILEDKITDDYMKNHITNHRSNLFGKDNQNTVTTVFDKHHQILHYYNKDNSHIASFVFNRTAETFEEIHPKSRHVKIPTSKELQRIKDSPTTTSYLSRWTGYDNTLSENAHQRLLENLQNEKQQKADDTKKQREAELLSKISSSNKISKQDNNSISNNQKTNLKKYSNKRNLYRYKQTLKKKKKTFNDTTNKNQNNIDRNQKNLIDNANSMLSGY